MKKAPHSRGVSQFHFDPVTFVAARRAQLLIGRVVVLSLAATWTYPLLHSPAILPQLALTPANF